MFGATLERGVIGISYQVKVLAVTSRGYSFQNQQTSLSASTSECYVQACMQRILCLRYIYSENFKFSDKHSSSLSHDVLT